MLHVPSHLIFPPHLPHDASMFAGVCMLHVPSHFTMPPHFPQDFPRSAEQPRCVTGRYLTGPSGEVVMSARDAVGAGGGGGAVGDG